MPSPILRPRYSTMADCQSGWYLRNSSISFTANSYFANLAANLKLRVRHFSDGGRSSMVEPQIVVLVVAGSSPVGHPASQAPNPKLQTRDSDLWDLELGFWDLQNVPVAQPDRAS